MLASAAAIIWLCQIFLLHNPAFWWVPVVVATGLMVAALIYRPRLAIFPALVMLSGLSLGFQVAQNEAPDFVSSASSRLVDFESVSQPQAWGQQQRVWIRVTADASSQLADQRLNLLGHLILREGVQIEHGGRYRAVLKFSPIPDQERGAFRAKLAAAPELLMPPDRYSATISNVKVRFLERLRGVTPDSAALVAGLAIGERSLLSEATALSMRSVSLTHLVAVSGANLAIIMGAVYLLAGAALLPRRLRFGLAALALLSYIALVGPEPSVLRAGAMALAVLVALWVGRGVRPIQGLAWAVIALLIFDPWLATDFGFALSSFATLGLLVLAPTLFQRLSERLPKWLALGLAVSFAAALFTMPILLLLQPTIPIYSVLANLLAEPAVAPVTILGITAVLLAIPLPGLAELLTLIASLGTRWIEFLAVEISSWPAAKLHWLPGVQGVAAMAILAASFWLAFQLSNRTMKASAALVCLLTAVFSLSWVATDLQRFQAWPLNDWTLVSCDVGQGDATVLKSSGAVALIDVGREPGPIEDCLDRLNIEHIDLLFLTHFDADHVGGISGALASRTVGTAFISGFADQRPLVDVVARELFNIGVTAQAGHAGLSGWLGELRWQILAPSVTAREAEDSNDASLVLSFIGAHFGFLALGDLGQPGQQRLAKYGMAGLSQLIRQPLVLKVSHHGSADQYPELHEWLRPEIALISSGVNNSYGHPADLTLRLLSQIGSQALRTDELGSIALLASADGIEIGVSGRLQE